MRISEIEFKEKINLNLYQKIDHSLGAIEKFYNETKGKCYISFSGGKDSTVLLHLVKMIYPDIPIVFINTRNEYPETYRFIKTIPNVIWLKPKYTVKQIIEKYGFPLISKEQSQYIHEYRNAKSDSHKNRRIEGNNFVISKKWLPLLEQDFNITHLCCYYLKKKPAKDYEKKTGNLPIIGTMASESNLRKTEYLKYGCNNFDSKKWVSRPLSIWTTDDIWEFIHKFKISYSQVYKDNDTKQTGCMFCGYGCHLKNDNRFEILKQNYPKVLEKYLNLKNNGVTFEEAISIVKGLNNNCQFQIFN
jgi:3'-phosphoadenosine 5'-phosphosulfate sulfotransferase (PAPS reductase)/FAD synthetase